MTDTFYLGLLVGPDKQHTIQFPLKSISELLEILTLSWPMFYDANTPDTELGARVDQVVNTWNDLWPEEKALGRPDRWKWQGLVLGGHILRKDVKVRWGLNLVDTPKMEMDIIEQ